MTETTPTTRFRRVFQRVFRFPVTRLVLALVCVAVGGMAGSIVRDFVATALSLDKGSAGRGALHHFNPGATWISSLSIALTAGVLLAAAFVVTRRLWLVIGIHFAWNFTQGGIFGVTVSGHEVDGLLRSELSGPELIAGGTFGPEASIFAVAFCVPVAAYLLVIGHRRGRFVRPMWKRRSGESGPSKITV